MDLPATDALNALPDDEFASALAPLFEGAPSLLRRLAAARPFESDDALLAAAHDAAATAPEAELLELLDAHPRIGAEAAVMSTMSREEQSDDGPDEASGDAPGVVEDLLVLNEIYEQRFGFRYVVFVAGRPRSAIVPLMEAALRNDREAELRRGVQDAIYIAGDRIRRARGVDDDPEEDGS
ncbi:MAG: 2-oxo-4-hydroxy-4-carboxy-5-ureidoimidazoline decarboxylase [Chloroflexota bacterium]|nr:2-oxo-4-hydroxy-4-carboxy-5-ureidoimidazoline decarboxylase [Chloroflexota bacterium]